MLKTNIVFLTMAALQTGAQCPRQFNRRITERCVNGNVINDWNIRPGREVSLESTCPDNGDYCRDLKEVEY